MKPRVQLDRSFEITVIFKSKNPNVAIAIENMQKSKTTMLFLE